MASSTPPSAIAAETTSATSMPCTNACAPSAAAPASAAGRRPRPRRRGSRAPRSPPRRQTGELEPRPGRRSSARCPGSPCRTARPSSGAPAAPPSRPRCAPPRARPARPRPPSPSPSPARPDDGHPRRDRTPVARATPVVEPKQHPAGEQREPHGDRQLRPDSAATRSAGTAPTISPPISGSSRRPEPIASVPSTPWKYCGIVNSTPIIARTRIASKMHAPGERGRAEQGQIKQRLAVRTLPKPAFPQEERDQQHHARD